MAFDANDLSPHEQFVVDRTRNGEVADFSPMSTADGGKPAVRAGFIRKLLLELEADWPVRSPGVRLKGARIEGVVDLTDCSGAGGAGLPSLSLEGCDIGEAVDLSRARVARLALRSCRIRKLTAPHAAIDGELDLSNAAPHGGAGAEAFTADLRGARLAGDLRATGAKFARIGDGAETVLALDGAEIGGDVLLDEGFDAFGGVSLTDARIDGRMCCDGGAILNRTDDAKGVAINARGAQIGASLRLKMRAEGEVNFAGVRVTGDVDLNQVQIRNEFGQALVLANAEIAGQVIGAAKIAGQVSLINARIGRNLDLRGAEIAHPLTPRGEPYGVAVEAASVSVGGAALLQGANIKGEVFLADARIAGYLAFGGGRFIHGGGWAVRAPNVRVGGNLTLKIDEGGYAPHGQKTVIEGGAKFERARIDGAFTWLNLELRGPGPDGAKGALMSLADACIRGPLQARALTAQQDSRVDLSGASCAALDDDIKTGWGVDRAELDLDGFAFGRVESADEKWRARLTWLRRAPRFSPQPYAMLAQVYARSGRRDDARRVLLAQHDARTRHASSGPLTWVLSSLFGITAGYGFAPIRALRTLVLFIAIGIAGVLAMNEQGALVTPSGAQCNGAIEPALYAIDVALPVVDLGQESRCAPGRTARAELSAGMETPNSDWRLFEGAALWKWAQAAYAVLGAILTALAVITFSGVMKPRDD